MEIETDWARAQTAACLSAGRRQWMGSRKLRPCCAIAKVWILPTELKINMLEAYGIPCLRIYPGDGSFGKLILGMSGQGVDIYVPSSLLEDAQTLCSAQAEEVSD